MRTPGLTLLFLAIVSLSQAQFKNPPRLRTKDFLSRKTILVQDNFKDPRQKDWLKKYWKFKQELVFVSADQIRTAVSAKDATKGIMTVGLREEVLPGKNGIQSTKAFVLALYLGEAADGWDNKQIEADKKREIFKIDLPLTPLGEQDFKFIGQFFYNYLSHAHGSDDVLKADKLQISSTSVMQMTSTVLLVPNENCHALETEIRSVYPYPFQKSDAGAIALAQIKNTHGHACMRLLFSDAGFNWAIFMVNTEDGTILNKLGASGLKSTDYLATGPLSRPLPANGKPLMLRAAHFKAITMRIKALR